MSTKRYRDEQTKEYTPSILTFPIEGTTEYTYMDYRDLSQVINDLIQVLDDSSYMMSRLNILSSFLQEHLNLSARIFLNHPDNDRNQVIAQIETNLRSVNGWVKGVNKEDKKAEIVPSEIFREIPKIEKSLAAYLSKFPIVKDLTRNPVSFLQEFSASYDQYLHNSTSLTIIISMLARANKLYILLLTMREHLSLIKTEMDKELEKSNTTNLKIPSTRVEKAIPLTALSDPDLIPTEVIEKKKNQK